MLFFLLFSPVVSSFSLYAFPSCLLSFVFPVSFYMFNINHCFSLFNASSSCSFYSTCHLSDTLPHKTVFCGLLPGYCFLEKKKNLSLLPFGQITRTLLFICPYYYSLPFTSFLSLCMVLLTLLQSRFERALCSTQSSL